MMGQRVAPVGEAYKKEFKKTTEWYNPEGLSTHSYDQIPKPDPVEHGRILAHG